MAGICRSYHESSDCFECAKKSLFKSSYQKKNIYQNFATQKNPEIETFTPKNSFGHPCHLKSAVPPLGVGLLFGTWNSFSLFYFLNTAKSIELACERLSMCHCIG